MNKKPRILVVDDDPAAQSIITAMLRQNYDCRCACNGAEALKALQEFDAEVLISDLMMPDTDGVELARRLKADERYGDTPLLLITAHEDGATLAACLDAGADDYLSKPLIRHEFDARVRAAVRLSRRSRQLKKTISELATTRDHLQAVLDNTSDAIVSYEADGRVLCSDRAATELLGLRSDSGHCSVLSVAVPQAAWQPGEGRTVHSTRSGQQTLEFRARAVEDANFRVAVVRDVTPYLEIDAEICDVRRRLTAASLAQQQPFSEAADAIIDIMSSMKLQTGMVRDSLRSNRRRRVERLIEWLGSSPDAKQEGSSRVQRDVAPAQALATVLELERPLLESELDALNERLEQACAVAEPCLSHKQASFRSLEDLLHIAVVLADGTDCVTLTRGSDVTSFHADHERFLEVVVHLLRNSVDAARRSSEPKVQVAIDQPGTATWRLRVTDNSAAIDAAAAAEVLDDGYSELLGGRSWGLRRCRELVDDLGGTLSVDSKSSGAETTVILELPNATLRPARGSVPIASSSIRDLTHAASAESPSGARLEDSR